MSKPKVLLTSLIPEKGIVLLKEQLDLEYLSESERPVLDELTRCIENKNGLICLLSDKIDRTLMKAAPNLKVIANFAAGYNNIDIEEATKRRIAVTNTPGVLTETTADLTFALILGIARRIVEADKHIRAGKFIGWDPMLMLGRDVYGKTLGIIGFGRIGQAVAQRARGFKMHILYHEPKPISHAIERTHEAIYCDLVTLLREADFVCLHIPLTDDTRYMISEQELALMKPSAYLINVARGPVVDEKALIKALNDERIAGCALDVYEYEPHVAEELINMTNTLLVPHIGSASDETRTSMSLMVAENIISVLVKKQQPPNIVNPEIYRE